jgi:molybdopterin-guanine dinucleotide biosynthesis protein A
VLAGGASRRMGRAKAALPFGGATILERIIAELRRGFDDLIIVAAPLDAEPFPLAERLANDAVVIRDDKCFEGPASALVRGLRAARHEIAFVCSCDLPLLRADVARALCTMVEQNDAAVPVILGRLQALYAAYSSESAGAIARGLAAGERRLTVLVESLKIRRVDEAQLRALDPELTSFTNINTPEDYQRALRMATCGR